MPLIHFQLDEQSHRERSAQVLVDGTPTFRLTRAALADLAREVWDTIRALDWIHATYLAASDIMTTKTHLMLRDGLPTDELRRRPVLCGRKHYQFEEPNDADGWNFAPVVMAPAINTTCRVCLRVYEKRERERKGKESKAGRR